MDFWNVLQFLTIIICMGLFMGIVIFMVVDGLTIKEIGEESVPCLDRYYRPFENEMCTSTITCSWLGLMGDERCKDAKEVNQE